MTRLMILLAMLPVLLLSGCRSSDPSAGLLPADETLRVRIHEDGSKFFTYTRESAAQPLAGSAAQRAFDTDIGPRLEQVVELSGYCRDGFFELFRERDPGVLTVHGECREGASDADRADYGDGQVVFFQPAR